MIRDREIDYVALGFTLEKKLKLHHRSESSVSSRSLLVEEPNFSKSSGLPRARTVDKI